MSHFPFGAPRRNRVVALMAGAVLLGAAALAWAASSFAASGITLAELGHDPLGSMRLARGAYPHPVHLQFPPAQPLSAVASIGQVLFNDPALSGSGRQSCASCHDPAHAFAPANDLAVQIGGRSMDRAGLRAVPSLAYLYRQPPFSIGPENAEQEGVSLVQSISRAGHATRATKRADSSAAGRNLVPQGGLFWDGRADTLQQQAGGPLFNPLEMDAGSADRVAHVIESGGNAAMFRALFGPSVFENAQQVVAEAMFAIARYQIESPAFHAFNSKFDAWMQGHATFTRQEVRGYLAFNDPRRGNCAACHLDRPTADGLPPLFTDTQYEALGVPRNPEIPANRDPAYHDLGICGPTRTDLRNMTQYCGMFLTPSLRNVATRKRFFHNGQARSLAQVLRFYNLRDVDPARIYPRGPDGRVEIADDLPAAVRANVDHVDPPFGRHPGEPPPMSERDMRDIIAFLHTLNDGWHSPH